MRKIFIVLLALAVGGFLIVQPALAQMQTVDRASKIIGQTAKDQQGRDVGKIEDVVTNREGNRVYLILSGEKLGKSNEYIPIPWQAANPRLEKGAVTLSLTEQRLRSAPAFKETEWSQFSQVEPKTNSYFGAAAPGGKPAMPSQQQKMTPSQKGAK